MGPWFTALFSAESAAVFAFVVSLLVVNLTVRMHLGSKQNAREHAELRKANDRNAAAVERNAAAVECYAAAMEGNAEAMERNAEAMERNAEGTDRNAEAIIRQAKATDRRFDSINRKLDQILSLLGNRSHKED